MRRFVPDLQKPKTERLKIAPSKTLSVQEWNSKESVLAGIASHCCLEWRVS